MDDIGRHRSCAVRRERCIPLPGIGLRSLAARTGPDFVELCQHLVGELHRRGFQVLLQLLDGARAADHRGDSEIVQEPGQCHFGRGLPRSWQSAS